MRKVKSYNCPFCNSKYKTLSGWCEHVDKMHPDRIPEDFKDNLPRYFYFLLTGKDKGSCIVCGSETDWNPVSLKYNRFCNNPECKKKAAALAKQNMVRKYGKEHLLDDPDMQRKMIKGRSISGTYKFLDGGEVDYTGTYERDFLVMMDKFLHYQSTDIMGPSPNSYTYEYDGKTRFYIPDFYMPTLNLEIEIKDGDETTEGRNMHHKIVEVDRVKEKLKDLIFKSNKSVNYIKIVNKEYDIFFKYLLDIKGTVGDNPKNKNMID